MTLFAWIVVALAAHAIGWKLGSIGGYQRGRSDALREEQTDRILAAHAAMALGEKQRLSLAMKASGGNPSGQYQQVLHQQGKLQ